VFQNRRLAERCVDLLAARGRLAHLPRVAPANDGGLALGQLMEVLALDVRADPPVAS
jgi:hydrogenase maturation protein HypF